MHAVSAEARGNGVGRAEVVDEHIAGGCTRIDVTIHFDEKRVSVVLAAPRLMMGRESGRDPT